MNFEKGTPEKAQELYVKILQTANYFLHSAKRYEISALKDLNPSFGQLAEIMKELAATVVGLTDEVDPTLSNKAVDYVDLMSRMAIAIAKEDSILLDELAETLYSRPFV